MICIFLLFTVARHFRRGLTALIAGIVLFAASFFADPPKFPPGRLTIDFLDVGQGDSILVTFPGQEHLLVDAGGTRTGRFDVGERIVVPTLRALGVTRLAAVALTHPDFDHAGGMASVLRAFEIDALWENGQGLSESLEGAYGNILSIARRRRIPIQRTPEICGVHRFGDAKLEVIHPCLEGKGFDRTRSFNANSIVLMVTFGDVRVVLTGDIDRDVERQLVESNRLSQADILKLPHHGSVSSSSGLFLDALSPGIAIVSAGPFNPHRMPHRSVRHRLRQRDIALFRTDRHGAVRVSTNGRAIAIAKTRLP
jgi:competence protein ComEC